MAPLFVGEPAGQNDNKLLPSELVRDALVVDPSLDRWWTFLLGAFGHTFLRHCVVATLLGVKRALLVLIGELDGLGHTVVGRGRPPLDPDIGVCSLFRNAWSLGGYGQTCVRHCVVAALLGVLSGRDCGDASAVVPGKLLTLRRTPAGSINFCAPRSCCCPVASTASEGVLAAPTEQDEEALFGAPLVSISKR